MVAFNGQVVDIPRKYGEITSAHSGQDRLVIHIQDLHCHYEVQKNIASLIGWLAEHQGVRLLGLEGNSEALDPSILRKFPIAVVREEVADYFVRQGKLTGPEYYAATGRHAVDLEGVEDADLYTANREIVDRLLKEEALGYCQDLRQSLAELKPAIFSGELLALDRSHQAYRQGTMAPQAFTRHLLKQARKRNVETSAFPGLRAYAGSGDGNPETNIESLFQDIDALDRSLRLQIAGVGPAAEWIEIERRLDIVEKLIGISASPEELEEFRAFPERFTVAAFISFYRRYAGEGQIAFETDARVLDHYLALARDFYTVADQRSRKLVDNLAAKMEKTNTEAAVLVTGGYHTAHVVAELHDRGFSVLSVKPRMTHQDLLNPYYSLLKNQCTPLEQWLVQDQKLFTLSSFLPTKIDGLAGLRERTFAYTCELLEKVKSLAYYYFRAQVSHPGERYAASLRSFQDVSNHVRLRVGEERIHPGNILTVPAEREDGETLMVLAGPEDLDVTPSERVDRVASGPDTVVFVRPERVESVLSRLDHSAVSLWAGAMQWLQGVQNNASIIDRAHPGLSLALLLAFGLAWAWGADLAAWLGSGMSSGLSPPWNPTGTGSLAAAGIGTFLGLRRVTAAIIPEIQPKPVVETWPVSIQERIIRDLSLLPPNTLPKGMPAEWNQWLAGQAFPPRELENAPKPIFHVPDKFWDQPITQRLRFYLRALRDIYSDAEFSDSEGSLESPFLDAASQAFLNTLVASLGSLTLTQQQELRLVLATLNPTRELIATLELLFAAEKKSTPEYVLSVLHTVRRVAASERANFIEQTRRHYRRESRTWESDGPDDLSRRSVWLCLDRLAPYLRSFEMFDRLKTIQTMAAFRDPDTPYEGFLTDLIRLRQVTGPQPFLKVMHDIDFLRGPNVMKFGGVPEGVFSGLLEALDREPNRLGAAAIRVMRHWVHAYMEREMDRYPREDENYFSATGEWRMQIQDILGSGQTVLGSLVVLAWLQARLDVLDTDGPKNRETLRRLLADTADLCRNYGDHAYVHVLSHEPTFERMENKPRGRATNRMARIVRRLLEMVPELQWLEPEGFPGLAQDRSTVDLEVLTLRELGEKAGLAGSWTLAGGDGRTVYLHHSSGREMIIKINAQGEGNGLLQSECERMAWTRAHRPQEEAPRPVMIEKRDDGTAEYRFILDLKREPLGDTVIPRLQSQLHGEGSSQRKSLLLRGSHAGYVATAYLPEAGSRYRYQLRPKSGYTWDDLATAERRSAETWASLLRSALVPTTPSEMFHNHVDGGRPYLLSVALNPEQVPGIGYTAGRLSSPEVAVATVNKTDRGGFRDYKYLMTLEQARESAEFNHPEWETIWKLGLSKNNVIVFEAGMRFLLSAMLEIAHHENARTVPWEGMSWDDDRSLGKLSDLVKDIHQQFIEGLMNQGMDSGAKAWVEQIGDWTRTARNMEFFLSTAYLPYLRKNQARSPRLPFPSEALYRLPPESVVLLDDYARYWDETRGLINGPLEGRGLDRTRSLGVWNGPLPADILSPGYILMGLTIARLGLDQEQERLERMKKSSKMLAADKTAGEKKWLRTGAALTLLLAGGLAWAWGADLAAWLGSGISSGLSPPWWQAQADWTHAPVYGGFTLVGSVAALPERVRMGLSRLWPGWTMVRAWLARPVTWLQVMAWLATGVLAPGVLIHPFAGLTGLAYFWISLVRFSSARHQPLHVYTYPGRLDDVLDFMRVFPPIRKLLEKGTVINDIGPGWPPVTSLALNRMAQTLNPRNRVIVAEKPGRVPSRIIADQHEQGQYAFFDAKGKLIDVFYPNGMVDLRPASRRRFALAYASIGPDYVVLDPERFYQGVEIRPSDFGKGIRAGIKIAFNLLYMYPGEEDRKIADMAKDLTEGDVVIVGQDLSTVTGDRLFAVCQKRQGQLGLSGVYRHDAHRHWRWLDVRSETVPRIGAVFGELLTFLRGRAGVPTSETLLLDTVVQLAVKHGLKPAAPTFQPLPAGMRIPARPAPKEENLFRGWRTALSPDMGVETVTHEERNAELKRLIRESRVLRWRQGRLYHERLQTAARIFSPNALEAAVKYSWEKSRITLLQNQIAGRLGRVRASNGPVDAAVARMDIPHALPEALGMDDASVRERLATLAKTADLLIVQNRFTLYEDGPLAHARRGATVAGDRAIWLGARLLTDERVSDDDVARLLVEEAKHILAPALDHAMLAHDERLLERLSALAESYGERPAGSVAQEDAGLNADERDALDEIRTLQPDGLEITASAEMQLFAALLEKGFDARTVEKSLRVWRAGRSAPMWPASVEDALRVLAGSGWIDGEATRAALRQVPASKRSERDWLEVLLRQVRNRYPPEKGVKRLELFTEWERNDILAKGLGSFHERLAVWPLLDRLGSSGYTLPSKTVSLLFVNQYTVDEMSAVFDLLAGSGDPVIAGKSAAMVIGRHRPVAELRSLLAGLRAIPGMFVTHIGILLGSQLTAADIEHEFIRKPGNAVQPRVNLEEQVRQVLARRQAAAEQETLAKARRLADRLKGLDLLASSARLEKAIARAGRAGRRPQDRGKGIEKEILQGMIEEIGQQLDWSLTPKQMRGAAERLTLDQLDAKAGLLVHLRSREIFRGLQGEALVATLITRRDVGETLRILEAVLPDTSIKELQNMLLCRHPAEEVIALYHALRESGLASFARAYGYPLDKHVRAKTALTWVRALDAVERGRAFQEMLETGVTLRTVALLIHAKRLTPENIADFIQTYATPASQADMAANLISWLPRVEALGGHSEPKTTLPNSNDPDWRALREQDDPAAAYVLLSTLAPESTDPAIIGTLKVQLLQALGRAADWPLVAPLAPGDIQAVHAEPLPARGLRNVLYLWAADGNNLVRQKAFGVRYRSAAVKRFPDGLVKAVYLDEKGGLTHGGERRWTTRAGFENRQDVTVQYRDGGLIRAWAGDPYPFDDVGRPDRNTPLIYFSDPVYVEDWEVAGPNVVYVRQGRALRAVAMLGESLSREQLTHYPDCLVGDVTFNGEGGFRIIGDRDYLWRRNRYAKQHRTGNTLEIRGGRAVRAWLGFPYLERDSQQPDPGVPLVWFRSGTEVERMRWPIPGPNVVYAVRDDRLQPHAVLGDVVRKADRERLAHEVGDYFLKHVSYNGEGGCLLGETNNQPVWKRHPLAARHREGNAVHVIGNRVVEGFVGDPYPDNQREEQPRAVKIWDRQQGVVQWPDRTVLRALADRNGWFDEAAFLDAFERRDGGVEQDHVLGLVLRHIHVAGDRPFLAVERLSAEAFQLLGDQWTAWPRDGFESLLGTQQKMLLGKASLADLARWLWANQRNEQKYSRSVLDREMKKGLSSRQVVRGAQALEIIVKHAFVRPHATLLDQNPLIMEALPYLTEMDDPSLALLIEALHADVSQISPGRIRLGLGMILKWCNGASRGNGHNGDNGGNDGSGMNSASAGGGLLKGDPADKRETGSGQRPDIAMSGAEQSEPRHESAFDREIEDAASRIAFILGYLRVGWLKQTGVLLFVGGIGGLIFPFGGGFAAIGPWGGWIAALAAGAFFQALRLTYLLLLAWLPPPTASPEERGKLARQVTETVARLGVQGALPPHYRPTLEWIQDQPSGWRRWVAGISLGHGSQTREGLPRLAFNTALARWPAWAASAVIRHEISESLGRGHWRASWDEHVWVFRVLSAWGLKKIKAAWAAALDRLQSPINAYEHDLPRGGLPILLALGIAWAWGVDLVAGLGSGKASGRSPRTDANGLRRLTLYGAALVSGMKRMAGRVMESERSVDNAPSDHPAPSASTALTPAQAELLRRVVDDLSIHEAAASSALRAAVAELSLSMSSVEACYRILVVPSLHSPKVKRYAQLGLDAQNISHFITILERLLGGVPEGSKSLAFHALGELTRQTLLYQRPEGVIGGLKQVLRFRERRSDVSAEAVLHEYGAILSMNRSLMVWLGAKNRPRQGLTPEQTARLAGSLEALALEAGPGLGLRVLQAVKDLLMLDMDKDFIAQQELLQTLSGRLSEWLARLPSVFDASVALAILRVRCARLRRDLKRYPETEEDVLAQLDAPTALDLLQALVAETREGDGLDWLKNEPALERITIGEHGSVENSSGAFARYLLEGIPATALPVPENLPPLALNQAEGRLPKLDLDRLAAAAGMRGTPAFVFAFGRKLVFADSRGRKLVVKLLKHGEQNRLLENENRRWTWYQTRTARHDCPLPVVVSREDSQADHRFVFVPGQDLEADLKRALREERADALARTGKTWQVDSWVAVAYVLEPDSKYETYLRPPHVKTWSEVQQSLVTAMEQLGDFAAEGMIHSALADLFHNLNGNDREYDVLQAMTSGSMGRLTAWPDAVEFQNIAADGQIRDFKYLMHVNEVRRNSEDWSLLASGFDRRLDPWLHLAEALGRDSLVALLDAGYWQDANQWKGLNWKKDRTLRRLANLMRAKDIALFQHVQGDADPSWQRRIADTLVDWTRYARQMVYWMDPVNYAKDLREPREGENDRRPERFPAKAMFGLDPSRVSFGTYRKGTYTEQGFVGDESEHEHARTRKAIGPVNGPFLIQEFVTATMYFLSLNLLRKSLADCGIEFQTQGRETFASNVRERAVKFAQQAAGRAAALKDAAARMARRNGSGRTWLLLATVALLWTGLAAGPALALEWTGRACDWIGMTPPVQAGGTAGWSWLAGLSIAALGAGISRMAADRSDRLAEMNPEVKTVLEALTASGWLNEKIFTDMVAGVPRIERTNDYLLHLLLLSLRPGPGAGLNQDQRERIMARGWKAFVEKLPIWPRLLGLSEDARFTPEVLTQLLLSVQTPDALRRVLTDLERHDFNGAGWERVLSRDRSPEELAALIAALEPLGLSPAAVGVILGSALGGKDIADRLAPALRSGEFSLEDVWRHLNQLTADQAKSARRQIRSAWEEWKKAAEAEPGPASRRVERKLGQRTQVADAFIIKDIAEMLHWQGRGFKPAAIQYLQTLSLETLLAKRSWLPVVRPLLAENPGLALAILLSRAPDAEIARLARDWPNATAGRLYITTLNRLLDEDAAPALPFPPEDLLVEVRSPRTLRLFTYVSALPEAERADLFYQLFTRRLTVSGAAAILQARRAAGRPLPESEVAALLRDGMAPADREAGRAAWRMLREPQGRLPRPDSPRVERFAGYPELRQSLDGLAAEDDASLRRLMTEGEPQAKPSRPTGKTLLALLLAAGMTLAGAWTGHAAVWPEGNLGISSFPSTEWWLVGMAAIFLQAVHVIGGRLAGDSTPIRRFAPGMELKAPEAVTSDDYGYKGARLIRMAALGLPVPPGFVLPTRFAADISRACNGDWRKGPEAWKHTRLDAELKRHLAYLSRICGERLGDERTPLLLSVRSGAQVTLPGVLGTVLFVGLNDKSVKGLEAQFGALEALRIYARTLLNFAVNVRGLQSERFSAAGPDEKPFAGMDENELRTLIVEYKRIIAEGGRAYPQDPFEQLRESILTVMESPERPDARAFLARHGLDGLRTGVSIQQMVFGSASGMSGSGVSYSCDLYTGADVPSVEFGWNLCGEDYVSGRITPEDTRDWRDLPEDLQDQLAGSAQTLENAFGAPQEMEFTLMRGRLYILQSRDAADALYPLAKARWLIRRTSGDPDATQTVVRMLTMDDVLWMKKALHAPPLKTDLESVIAGKPASPGIGQGFPACTREQALARMRENKPFILVVRRSGLEHQDLIESPWCRGTLELYGSVMSHAASLMRREKNLARPSIVAAPIDLVNDGRTIHLRLDGRLVSDVITLDGNTGKVYLGLCPQQHIPGHEHDADGQDLLKQLENWEHQLRPGMPNPETESPGPLIEGLLRGHIPAGIGAEAARALRRIEDTLPTMLARAKSGDEKSNTTLRNVVAFLVVRDEIVPAIHGTEEEEVQALHLLKAVEGEVLADLAKDDLARFLEAMVDADPELLSAMLRYPDWRHRPYFSWLLRIAQTRPELYTKVLETALIPVGELWPEERKNYAWTTRFLLSSALALADDRAVLDRFVGLRPQTLVSVLAELFCPENGEGEYLDTLGDLSRDDAWRDWSTWGGLAQDALTAWARRAPWKVTAFWNAVEKADQVNRSAWLAPAFRARGIVPGKNRPPLLTPILLGGLTSAGLIVAAVMTGYTATHPAEVIAAGRDSGLVRPEIGYILTAVAAFLLGAGRIGKWFGKIPAWRNWLGEAGSAPTLELEAGRALSERHPRWFRSLEGFIQPGKGLRPWLRPLRLLHGAVAGLLTLALRLYLRRTPAVTPGQERLLNSREQALLVQDVVTALKIDTHAITVRPTSSRKPSSRFFAGSTWGEVDYLDDHLVLWVPDRLLAPSSPFDAILHDYAFFALSQRLRTFLPRWAEDDAGERHRSDSRLAGWSLRASGWLPNGLARLWHRFWLNRAPGMYMEYLHDSMALHSSLSQNLRMEWRDWLPVVLAMRVNADSSGRPFLEHALKWMQQQREHFPAPGNRGRAINHLPINRMWLSLQDFAACMRACPILKSREFGTHGLRLPLELRPFWQGVYHDLLRPFGIRMEREDGTPAAPPRRRLLETGA